jgi:hypothetical protein
MEKELREELEKYLARVLENYRKQVPVGMMGMGTAPEIGQVSKTVAEECMKLYKEYGQYQSVDECIKRAREIAKEKCKCCLSVTVTYHDGDTNDY